MPVEPDGVSNLSEGAQSLLHAHRESRAIGTNHKSALLERIEGSIGGGADVALEQALESQAAAGSTATAAGSGKLLGLVLGGGLVAVVAGAIVLSPPAPDQDPGVGATVTQEAVAAPSADAPPERVPQMRDELVPAPELVPPPEEEVEVDARPDPSTRAQLPTSRPHPRTQTSKPHPAPSDSTLAAEMKLLARARAALNRGDESLATKLVAQHRAKFPRGQMIEDREVIGLKALCGRNRDEARRRAARFLKQHPQTLAADSVDDVCP